MNFLSLSVYAQSIAEDIAGSKRERREIWEDEERDYNLVPKVRAVRQDLISFWEGIEPSSSLPSPFASESITFDKIRGHLRGYDVAYFIREYLNERSPEKNGKKELEKISTELERLGNGQSADIPYILDFFDNLAAKSLYLSRIYSDEDDSSLFVPEGVKKLTSKVRAA